MLVLRLVANYYALINQHPDFEKTAVSLQKVGSINETDTYQTHRRVNWASGSQSDVLERPQPIR